MSILHARVDVWNKSEYKKFKLIIESVIRSYANHADKPLVAPIEPDNHKLKKFVSMFGFKHVAGYIIGDDGNIREIYSMGEN